MDDSHSCTTNSTSTSSKFFETSEDAESKDDYPINDLLLTDIDSESSSQRSILLTRRSLDDSFGFALQSYVFKRSETDQFERITYIDYVSSGSPASRGGIRRGDMVIAVNGNCVITNSHSEIVESITNSLHVTLILVFKDIARIVSLTMRSIQLKCLLDTKKQELEEIEDQEKQLILDDGISELDISSTLYELDEELKNNSNSTDFRHLIRINSSSSMGSTQITRL
ncbi:unnamed protein product [Caenorhabditis angaria]|uniref:PDZ domain-containing protein n=1 Tax=Caenorhabditis angaria TaxID=860376 RepID=A0A9P1I7U6_9PELO|nr:unnamed protein product [Caenorhabditis angaria]